MTKLGLIGAGVMGRALASNFADQGAAVVVHDRDAAALKRVGDDPRLTPAETPVTLVAHLERPRTIVLMVNAGKPVDAAIADLLPLLSPGDLIVDGGNSDWRHTEKRTAEINARGIEFMGLGVSGGEEGARRGPALMAGGSEEAYTRIAPLLQAIAAKADGKPCVDWFGKGGGGHFVKMAHNAIEYGVMQAIGEAVQILRTGLGLSFAGMHRAVLDWGRGPRASYLLELTADILRRTDKETGRPLLEIISDRAGQKGTGGWAVEAALSLGVAVPTLAQAVFARTLSGAPERGAAVTALGPAGEKASELEPSVVGDAVFAATLACYAQGFQLIRAGAAESGWVQDPARAARVWQAGCILRARLLHDVEAAFAPGADLPNMLLSPQFAPVIRSCDSALRRTVAFAALHGIAAPALSSALAYLDGVRTVAGPTAMVQAMRDGFGRHGFERIDKPGGGHHADWS